MSTPRPSLESSRRSDPPLNPPTGPSDLLSFSSLSRPVPMHIAPNLGLPLTLPRPPLTFPCFRSFLRSSLRMPLRSDCPSGRILLQIRSALKSSLAFRGRASTCLLKSSLRSSSACPQTLPRILSQTFPGPPSGLPSGLPRPNAARLTLLACLFPQILPQVLPQILPEILPQ
eukprot:203585-Chlamydomonas_euryale.AAC.1